MKGVELSISITVYFALVLIMIQFSFVHSIRIKDSRRGTAFDLYIDVNRSVKVVISLMRFYLTNDCLQVRTVNAEVIRAIDGFPKQVLYFHRLPRV